MPGVVENSDTESCPRVLPIVRARMFCETWWKSNTLQAYGSTGFGCLQLAGENVCPPRLLEMLANKGHSRQSVTAVICAA